MTTLEQLLSKSQTNQLSDKSFLDFSNAKISKIGNIPSEIALQVQALNLANNNLRSLEGIEQFKKLQSLGLANNKIYKSQGLLIIKNLLHLKKISLSGNPFLENPLTEEILTLLSSYENDLQILNFVFQDKNRQTLVNDHKRCKSQSRILGKSQVKKINSQEDLQKFSRALQISKAVQKSKVNMLMSNMQQFIEQRQESQEISSYEFENNDHLQSHQENSNRQMNVLRPGYDGFTPMRKSPKFGSFSIKQQGFNSLNQTQKFQEESTNIKQKNISNSKIVEESFPYESRTQTKQERSERVSWQKSLRNDEKKSPEKKFKYQVDNLKINMDLEDMPLNYPSIIEKEDQDSYQIEFDFMSPKKIQSPSKSKLICSQVSPSRELKELTHSYVRIQEDEVIEEEKEEPKKEQFLNTPPIILKTERPRISEGTLAFLTKNMASQNPKVQKKTVSKVADKQNYYQKLVSVEAPLNLAKKGSLHESTRSVGPQLTASMAQDVINKLLNQRALQQGQSFSLNFSLGEMLQNAQKFQKFYYTSLTRLKPAFSLLYSPFNSLKAQEKDLLLQELFKNHKQIFILLIREFYTKEKLEEELDEKCVSLQRAEQQLSQNKVINAKIEDYQKALAFQKSRYNQIDMQNRKLKRYIDQFDDILTSREKIINDTKRQYEKANKALKMKEEIVQKSLNEDEIQERIIELSEARIKNKFIKIIQKKAQWALRFQNFVEKRQQKQNLAQQTRQKWLKKIIFQRFQLNMEKENLIKQFVGKCQNKKVEVWFHEWKIQTSINKIRNQFEHERITSQKTQFLAILNEFYLNKKRKQKLNDMNKIRIQRKIFYQGFKKNCQEHRIKNSQGETEALKLLRKNLLQTYFHAMKSFVQDQSCFRFKEQMRIQKQVILKNQFKLFRKICRYQDKQQQVKLQQLQEKIIKSNEISWFLTNLKAHSQVFKRITRNSKISVNYRLRKIFKVLKKFMKKNVKLQNRFQDMTRKIIHERRMRTLVVQFRQNLLRLKLEKSKKKSFYELSKNLTQNKHIIQKKKSDVSKILDFRRGLRAKNELISLLRHENMKKKMTNKRLVMQHHYLIQESKYKQSYQLNILTMEQLKDEVQTYLNEIEFYKLQVQKLSQRELFLLEQKENCLLEIQCKQEENLELKKTVLNNEQKLEDLQRKYEKSLDMYAAAMDEMNEQQKAMQKSFFYNTILPTAEKEFQTAIRKQLTANQSFCSLKR